MERADAPVRRGSSLVLPARKHLGAVDFVRRLEEVLIRTSADFGIETKRIPGLTGVWTNSRSRCHPERKRTIRRIVLRSREEPAAR